MSDRPSLDVIVVNWNTCRLLARCLASVEAHPPGVNCTLWVVDNGSQDDSVALVRTQFPAAQLIANTENVGFARANNQALERSSGDFVLLLNSDAMLPAGGVDAMLSLMAARPKAGIVGPMLLNLDGSFQASYAHFPTIWSEIALLTRIAGWLIGPYAPSPAPLANEVARPVDWVPGTALLARRAAVDQVGGLDEEYFMYSEDTDWCWRMSRLGWEVWYAPDARVMHVGSASSQHYSPTRYVRLYRSKLRFLTRAYGERYGTLSRVILGALVAVRCATWIGMQAVPGLNRPAMRARWRQDMALLRSLAGVSG